MTPFSGRVAPLHCVVAPLRGSQVMPVLSREAA